MLVVFFVACFLGAVSALRPPQAYGVEGKLMCGFKPAGGIHIKLYDKDTGPDPDDLMGEVYSGPDGSFRLQGTENEVTPIDPELYIYHDCDDGIKPGSRQVKIILPKSYIASGTVPKTFYPIGILNLESEFTNEKRHFIG